MHRISLWSILFAAILAACSPTTPSPLPAELDPAAMQMVEKAREHLIKKFKLSSDQVGVFSVQAVTWPDSGLGCPQQGISYAQVETPGYMILLESRGQTYNYHTDASENVILCDSGGPGEIFLPP
jgi:hypothetical protein